MEILRTSNVYYVLSKFLLTNNDILCGFTKSTYPSLFLQHKQKDKMTIKTKQAANRTETMMIESFDPAIN